LTETDNYVAGIRQATRQWSAGHTEDPPPAVIPIRLSGKTWSARLAPVLIAAALMICVLAWFGRHSAMTPPPPFAVELTAVRGTAPEPVPAGRPLLLALDLTGLGDGQPFTGELVDSAGSRVATFPVGPTTSLKALAPGRYFVRIYKTSGQLLREYALTVKR